MQTFHFLLLYNRPRVAHKRKHFMSMRASLLLLMTSWIFISSANAQMPVHRFWQGFQRSDLNQVQFEQQLNARFFPLYPQQVPYGLISYLPVLPTRALHPDLGQEWALVSYQSADHYRVYKESDLGKFMGDAHWKVFDQSTSKSIVPEPYLGKSEMGHAYDLHPRFNDYAHTKVVFQIAKLTLETGKLFNRIHQTNGLRNHVFLQTESKVISYWFFDQSLSPGQIKSILNSLSAKETILLKAKKPAQAGLTEGTGLQSLL